ncbi:MAG TPA: 30S ribosomal protein S7 [Methanoregulaceae archaeon]|nr:30S ribosomal protein S7 [Methanolinea sp.]MDD5685668.1 30S ribosomal protein S7 [Methanoregulaceae archaeon]HOP66383.1 30S ribosomal protein S7 [Methanoregulaceae archaeon]HPJ74353.1 30S ribosomal protein S7 [Methanoregulaceae archaeon]HPQ76199.1 30S ribosomal protein S7 [Methanoregulaceae archaeon]
MTETEVTQRLLFNRWDLGEVQITDPGLVRYISLNPVIVPHSTGKFTRQEFNKANMLIVERLINRLMQTEVNTGNKQLATRIVRDSFEIIHKKTKKNPVQVLVEAIANTGPREETVRLKYGGINVPKSVDTAPLRRVNSSLVFISDAVKKAAHKSKKPVAVCLADELIAASKGDVKTYSVNKKEERERIAKSAR